MRDLCGLHKNMGTKQQQQLLLSSAVFPPFQGDQIWAQSGPDFPEMGQIRGFFKDKIQHILAHQDYRAKMY